MTEVQARVAMVILHRHGRVLMQLRGSEPGTYAGGLWGIFGGHLEAGETAEQAARREVQEELGFTLEGAIDLVAHRIDDGRERFIYAAPLPLPLEAIRLAEGDGMALLTADQVESYPVVSVHREVLRAWWQGVSQREV
jgi:8-oxo-dGTP diphosphatase